MAEVPIIQNNLPPGFIDLGLGNPNLDLLPLDLLRQSAETYFSKGDPRPLQYGVEQGDGFFRLALSDLLMKTYGAAVDPDLLFVTTGVSGTLNLLCSLFTRPGDVIFVEELTYFLALRIFEDHDLQIVPIPIDEDGLCVDALEEKLAESIPKFIYTIPTFQNPTGCTLPKDRREKLVQLANCFNFLVIADEVYHFLPYSQIPPLPLAIYTTEVEQIISLNSFTKILAPGLRLGWLHAHESVIKRIAGCGLLDSGGGLNPFLSALVRGSIESGGLQENISHLRAIYTHRLKVLDGAIRQYLPQAEYTLPNGGFFIWMRLPGIDVTKLRLKARDFEVDFRQGSLFSIYGKFSDYARLCLSYYEPDDLVEGVKRLQKALDYIA